MFTLGEMVMLYEDSWDKDKVKINKEVLKQENEYLKAVCVDFESDKKYARRFEKFCHSPQSYFCFRVGDKLILGRKHLSDLVLSKGLPGLFCCRISKEMILGDLCNFRVSEDGIEFVYKVVTRKQKEFYFKKLLSDSKIEISYPVTQLLGPCKMEKGTPKDGWVVDKERAEFLSLGEEIIRNYTIKFLKEIIDVNEIFKVYDPACSTGKFLSTIKKAFSNALTIGQELSKQMVEYAKESGGVDEVYFGDSIVPAVQPESMDFVFFRFLNGEVVSTNYAKKLFLSLSTTIKRGGYAILFGHTPVLLDAEWIVAQNFKTVQLNGHTEDYRFVFQYMVFQKK